MGSEKVLVNRLRLLHDIRHHIALRWRFMDRRRRIVALGIVVPGIVRIAVACGQATSGEKRQKHERGGDAHGIRG